MADMVPFYCKFCDGWHEQPYPRTRKEKAKAAILRHVRDLVEDALIGLLSVSPESIDDPDVREWMIIRDDFPC